MSDPQLPPPQDDPSRSPGLLAPLPKRGPGVRRLNKVPIWVFVGGACLVVGAIGYTYKVRLQSSAASQGEAVTKAEPASSAAVLNGAPQSGEIQSAAFRQLAPAKVSPAAPAQEVQSRRGPSDQQQQTQGDDPAEQARKQAWQTYYQQLAALQQQRQQDALGAMKADTSPNGAGVGGGSGQSGTPNVEAQSAGQPGAPATPTAYAAGGGFAPGGP